MLILHQYYISPFCEKIRRQLHWKGIDYQVKEYPLMARKQVAKLSAAAKLPCLEHDGQFIGDSTNIAYHIEDKFPNKSMLPKDESLLGLMHILEDWADESLYFYEMYCRFYYGDNGKRNLVRMLANDKPLVRIIMSRLIKGGLKKLLTQQGLGRKKSKHVFDDLNRQLSALNGLLKNSQWLVGDSISLADISVYPMITAISDGTEGREYLMRYNKVIEWMKTVEDATGGKTIGSLGSGR